MATKSSKTTRTSKQPRLTLHQLLGAISFWGSSTRLLLIGFIIAIITILKFLYVDTSVEWEAKVIIYVLGSFALLEIGYVMLARAHPLRRAVDTFGLLGAEILLSAIYILPNMIHLPGFGWLSNWLFLIVLFVLGLRALSGLLFATVKR